jgi:hypothetical protein
MAGDKRTSFAVARTTARGRRRAALVAALLVAASAPVLAQGWWPWSQPEERPVPREPVYRPPAEEGPLPGMQPAPGAGAWSAKGSICLQLEQRLVQEGQRSKQSRDIVPMVENEIRQVETNPLPLAVLRVSREIEFGLQFYRDQNIARYELGQIPDGEHLVLAPEGMRARIEKRAPGRRVSYLGRFAWQHLEYYWVSAPGMGHQTSH